MRSGPVGDIFDALNDRPAFQSHGRIGVVGLGTGTIAAYPRKGQSLTYYEIDAAVRRIAEDPHYFTYLANCRDVHEVDYQVKMGDARLTLAGEPDNAFDLLVIDAFSSDSIPIHLITREAMELYRKKLAPGGFLVVHVSNRHLDLPPVVAAAARELRLVALLCDDEDESEIGKSASTWAVLVQNKEDLGRLQTYDDWLPMTPERGVPIWTDDYSSIVSVMNWSWLPKWLRPVHND